MATPQVARTNLAAQTRMRSRSLVSTACMGVRVWLSHRLLKNSGLEGSQLGDKLRVIHKSELTTNSKKLLQYGFDLFHGKIQNNVKKGIIEPAISKIRSIQIATEAAISILRIDDFIVAKGTELPPSNP